ncbi:hypothetical protein GV64_05205 [Endozoicomonas elysicola]|uniref:Uncharacterized protein n=1 Tax=Endozoicomonas elysicola TaxID=305900 RepID=A0A081K7U6_9GAMM|nr:hypothetical protein GV64_05205 [Endozoicomonas elysicola]
MTFLADTNSLIVVSLSSLITAAQPIGYGWKLSVLRGKPQSLMLPAAETSLFFSSWYFYMTFASLL